MKNLVVGGVCVVVALVIGCPRGDKAEAEPEPAALASPVVSAATGTVLVRARFVGAPPAPKRLPRDADAFCGKTRMSSEELLVRDGAIENVVVRVVGGTVPAFAPVSPERLTVDQVNCMYRPRVQVASAGATLVVRNSDPVAHNVHPEVGDRTLFNRQMLDAGSFTKTVKDLGVVEGVIAFGCDIHPWMNGFVVVSPHRAAAVTGTNGEARFEAPAGTHVVEAWHETLGTTKKTVVVEAGETVEVDVALGAR